MKSKMKERHTEAMLRLELLIVPFQGSFKIQAYDTQAIEIPKKWLVTITQGRSPSSIEAFPQKSS
jgi:hypothetical protein